MSARAGILARLRAAPSIAVPAPDVGAPDLGAYYARHSRGEDGNARLLRFKAAIEAAHAEVIVTDADAWPDRLLEIARAKGLRNLLVGAGAFPAGELAKRPQSDVAIVGCERIATTPRGEWFETIGASLTLARGAIAETGSLIVWPDAAEPRAMSLVPPVHFVLLEASGIHADLHGAMRAECWADGLPTNALLISGPSKTADIQQTLAYGAHGPRELVVLIVPSFGVAQ